MSGFDTLLLTSGGIDSTYCLWRRAKRGLKTRTHHVILTDRDHRENVERRATQNVLAWVARRYNWATIAHSESSMDMGEMWGPDNYHIWAFWTACILGAPEGQHINRVVIPVNKCDGLAAQRFEATFDHQIRQIARRRVDFEFPIAHMTKQEVIGALPPDLLSLTWSCRWPQDGTERCHRCAPCVGLDRFYEEQAEEGTP